MTKSEMRHHVVLAKKGDHAAIQTVLRNIEDFRKGSIMTIAEEQKILEIDDGNKNGGMTTEPLELKK